MADGMVSGSKIPTWLYFAAGGGVLLILLSNKGNKQSVETDNLLMAELDATLKSMQERMEQDNKDYREEQNAAWEEWMASLEEMLNYRYGINPPTSDDRVRYYTGAKPKNAGSEGLGLIPDVISSGVFDNYVMGFNYKRG